MGSEWVPVGYRFHPNDEELVNHYLKFKMEGNESRVKAIAEVEVCKWEPWELPKMSIMKSDDQVWYFFCPRDLKFPKGPRLKRMTKAGFWKATGRDRKVKTRKGKELIGTKKTLVFHEGRVPNGIRTNWVMHEYHPFTIPTGQRAFVLCVLKKKPDDGIGLSSDLIPDIQNQVTEGSVSEFGDHLYANLGSDIGSMIQPLDYELSSMLQSPMQTEQGPPLDESPFTNSFYSSGLQSNFGTDDQDEYCFHETIHALLSDSTPPGSLMRLGVEDGGLTSDPEAETVPARHYQVQGDASKSNECASSKEVRMMRMVHAPFRTVSSSNRDLHVKEDNNFHVDELNHSDTSSIDSDTKHEVNSIFLDHQEETLDTRMGKSSYRPTSRNLVSPVIARTKTQISGISLCKAVHVSKGREAKKHVSVSNLQQQKSIVEPVKECSPKTSAGPSSKPRENGSVCMDRKSSFIVLETPTLSRMSNPPSVYLVNSVIGSLLFIAVIWELFLFEA